MHEGAYRFVESAVKLAERGPVVEIGGRNINGGVRGLFPKDWPYLSVDLYPGHEVDVVADARDWTPATPAGVVVCCEVLEHSETPQSLIRAAWRSLAPGGLFIVTAAADPREPHSGIHGGPLAPGEHYGNIEPKALADWLRPFVRRQVKYAPAIGDVYAWALKP